MGKHKYIETPEKLLELFNAFVTLKKSTPRIIEKATNKGIQFEKHFPPLTMAGFEVYCFEAGSTVDHYFRNTDDSYNAYRPICSHIKRMIREDQIEGGMVGEYNPSITQRLNGLTERQDVTSGGDTVQGISVIYVNEDKGDASS